MDIWTLLVDKLNLGYTGFMAFSNQSPIVAGVVSLWGLGIVTFVFLSIPSKIFYVIKRQLTTDLDINNQDEIYYLFLQWLGKHKMHSFVRTFNLSHKNYYGFGISFLTYGYGLSVFMFNSWPVFIFRTKVDASATIHSKETIKLTVLGRNAKLITELFEEVKKKTNNDEVFAVYNYKDNMWTRFTTVRKRTFNTLALPQTTSKALDGHFENFAKNKSWYIENGIPYKTGIILHGPPGTGKTSIVSCLCSELKKDCYILDLNSIGDASLKQAFASVPTGGIILLEDVDTIFSKRKSISIQKPKETAVTQGTQSTAPTPNCEPSNDLSSLFGPTLGGILNALDGIGCGTDRIVIATTNFYEKLDSALIREGRFDLTLKIDYMTDETLRNYLCRLYPNLSRTDLNDWKVKTGIAPCRVQQLVFEHKTDPYHVLNEVATEHKLLKESVKSLTNL